MGGGLSNSKLYQITGSEVSFKPLLAILILCSCADSLIIRYLFFFPLRTPPPPPPSSPPLTYVNWLLSVTNYERSL